MRNPEKISVTFWGTRGSISTPGANTQKYGGNTPCVSIEYKDTFLILDAGTGIRDLGLELTQQAEKRKSPLKLHLLLSHTHWDHIQGLPFFGPAYLKGAKIAIYGSSNKESFLAGILQRQMDVNYFPVEMNALAADLSIIEISRPDFRIGPLHVRCQEQVCHPGGSVRYSIAVGGKKIVYATDVELDRIYEGRHRTGRTHKALAKDYLDFIRGADLLIADGQYTDREYPFRSGWGHSSIPVVIRQAVRAKVKQVAVFHHDPQHTDSMLDRFRETYAARSRTGPNLMVFWAREGMTLAV